MFLAAKVEEIVAPSAMNFLYCADSSYTEAGVLQAEKYTLKTLEWNMKYAAKKFMKVQFSFHPCHVALTEMDGLRLARTYACGPLSDGRRSRKSIWQKSFLRSRRSFGFNAGSLH
jgi:hypothetical protein